MTLIACLLNHCFGRDVRVSILATLVHVKPGSQYDASTSVLQVSWTRMMSERQHHSVNMSASASSHDSRLASVDNAEIGKSYN